MNMDKFNLKWNDFQSNVSRSFDVLRQAEDFFDVTLVSDDEEHISTHKLVLSASSDFFRNILRKASHSNPMIYLHGFGSKELQFVMDYIYLGEIQVLQDDLDHWWLFKCYPIVENKGFDTKAWFHEWQGAT